MYFPVSYSTLSDKVLHEFLREKYNIQNLLKTTYYLRGMNDTYLVTTTVEKFIFRVYRGDRRREYSEIASELALLRFLSEQGISVSLPIPDIEEELIQTLEAPEGNRFGVLFTFAKGSERGIDSEEISFVFGRDVAKIHLQSDRFEQNFNRQRLDLNFLLHETASILESALSHRKNDLEFLMDLGKQLEQSLLELPLNSLDWGICHGDLHGNTNVSYTQDLSMTHYDFDLCGYGWRAYDIAEFRLAREVRLGHDTEQLERLWMAFIEGYRSVRTLSELDLRAVPLFVGVRQFWLMGLCLRDPHIYGGIDFGDEFIDSKMLYFRQLKERLYGGCSEILQ